ncbi:MAG: hypothetical protein CFE34_17540 [Rhodobacteraceae bacterium PARR1]|nr:MAG: hypothetical protein CFE34_17540 [Rhodobacteraceae bacterium PARR1]
MPSDTLTSGAIRTTGLAMLFVLAALSAILVVENYNAERSKAAISAHRAAHVVATQFGWVFETSGHVLGRLDDSVSRQGFGQPGGVSPQDTRGTLAANGAALGAALGAAVRDLPAGLEYSLFDSQGQTVLSSPLSPPLVGIRATEVFKRLKAGEKLVITPMVGAPDDAAPVFLMGRRLGEGADFHGIAVVMIPVSMLQSMAETLAFVDGSTVSLVAADGMVLARSPPIRPMNLKGTALFDALAKAPNGSYETVSPADGVARIVGYWALPDWPVVAIAARDRSSALVGFWRNLGLSAVLAMPIVFGVGWLIFDLMYLMALDERNRQALTAAHDRASFLLREIHHRVKNNLSTVTSLIRLERLPEEVKDRLHGRIRAMVDVHEAMYLSDAFEDICISPYLGRLLDDIARGWGLAVDLRVTIPRLRLPGAQAMALGLLTNELVSNAFKHAFAPRGGGRLEVRIDTASKPGWLRLTVADDGPGYSVADNPAQMGSRLIEAFAAQLGGHVRVQSVGSTVVTVDFPHSFEDDTAAGLGDSDQPRPAQNGSGDGSRSIKTILLSIHARSSSRT